MPSIASNLLMCVCAGTMGAMSVPVVKKIRAPRPAVQRMVAPAPEPAPAPAAEVNCTDTLVLAPLSDVVGEADAAPFARKGQTGGLRGQPGLLGGGLSGAGGPLGIVPPGAGLLEAPMPAGPGGVSVPEPESWVLMISGFGAVGLAMRGRRETLAKA